MTAMTLDHVTVFSAGTDGYCAYRYPNGHQALYWFSQKFKKPLMHSVTDFMTTFYSF